MEKQALKDALLMSLDEEINAALAAANEAQATASHESNKPENQYDTLALEAAYLAHGQSERILQLQRIRISLGRWQVPLFGADEAIRMGACVVLESEDGTVRRIFITPVGGHEIIVDTQPVLVVNQDAPVTRLLVGQHEGDEVSLTLGGKSALWEIIAVS